MSQKNYYQLLQVSPNATAQEIKAAYRKLAFQYHPDRHKGNIVNEAVFKEINEAYSVLSNPEKRKFYNASIAINSFAASHQRPAPVTSNSILQHAIKLRTFVEKSNVLSINQDLVFHKIHTLLSGHQLHILLLENNTKIIYQFIRQILLCMQPLTSKNIQSFFSPLQQLAGDDETMQKEIQVFFKQKKGEAFWQHYKMLLVITVALLLCLLMYILK